MQQVKRRDITADAKVLTADGHMYNMTLVADFTFQSRMASINEKARMKACGIECFILLCVVTSQALQG